QASLANPTVDRIRQYVQIIKNENNRLKNQVERVLQIAALSPKKVGLQNSIIDIHALIMTAADNFRMQAEELDGTLVTRLEAQQHQVKGDLVHVTNVIYNLIDNAVKYTEESPSIQIRTSSAEGWLKVEIQDNGIGISKANQKMIFQKFYRVPTGNLHSVRGYGLGLFYVKTIIKAHGGKILLDSEPGKGSTFTIQLKTI
ncbi:MAG: sensor histidine kinase, partial [Flavobacteriales bacterium]